MSDQNLPLVGIVQEYNSLMSLLLESGGELTPELEQALMVTGDLLAVKADRYEFIISKLDSEESYWKERAERYTRVARACTAAKQRLRDAIKGAMQAMDIHEVSGEATTWKLVNSAPRLVIEEAKLSGAFITETVTFEPNKEKIRESLKAGLEVQGARFEPVVALRASVNRKAK